MRSARRVGEAGTHPTPTDHVRWPTQTASSGESEGKNRVNSSDIAAAACGDNFLPAGFTEFAGWSDSAKQILRFITHKGDCLKADEEGERFDAGAEATWATRKHRSFMIHAVAAAAARATYRAAAAESKRNRLAAPLPASIKQCAFHHIHAPHRRARRNAEMRNLLPNTVR